MRHNPVKAHYNAKSGTRTFQFGVSKNFPPPNHRSEVDIISTILSNPTFKMTSNRLKPKVGIIFSQTDKFSGESFNLASYICGLLSTSGYSDIYMIGYQSDGMPGEVFPRRIKYIPRGQTSPKEVPVSDVTFAHFHALLDCHLIVMTVNSNDTKSCCTKLAEVISNPKQMPVFSLQRGVRNSTIVKEELESKGFTVIESVVGFAVVPDAKSSAAVATMPRPAIVFERLSKEAVKVADGPLRLLERMDVDISFRKTLTPQSWGVLVYENLYALNVLTKGSLLDTLQDRENRLVLALMVRESYKILNVAARGGVWKPDLLLINPNLTPWMLEMILALPNALFFAVFWWLRLLPAAGVISPGQLDIVEGRKSMLDWHFAELVQAGERHKYDAPVCTLVLRQLKAIEAGLFPDLVDASSGESSPATMSGTGEEIPGMHGSPGGPSRQRTHSGHVAHGYGASSPLKTVAGSAQSSTAAYNATNHIDALMLALNEVEGNSERFGRTKGTGKSVISGHPTLAEWWFWMSRLFALLASLFLVVFLFLHDY